MYTSKFFNVHKINFTKVTCITKVNFISPFFIVKSRLKTKSTVIAALHTFFLWPCHTRGRKWKQKRFRMGNWVQTRRRFAAAHVLPVGGV